MIRNVIQNPGRWTKQAAHSKYTQPILIYRLYPAPLNVMANNNASNRNDAGAVVTFSSVQRIS